MENANGFCLLIAAAPPYSVMIRTFGDDTMGQNCYGKNLAVLATAIAIEISQGMSATNMNILGALFNVVGDQLALLAATKQAEEECAQDASQNNSKNGGKDKSAGDSSADSGKSG